MREFLENCIDYKELDVDLCGSFCCAQDALRTLAIMKPDLVITDIVMPGMDGIEFMSEMLKINQDTHFVVISNYQDFDVVRSALRIGVCDYIPKTDFEPEYYKETIMEFIKNYVSENEVKPAFPDDNDKFKGFFWGEEQLDNDREEKESFLVRNLRFALIDILNYESISSAQWQLDKGYLKYKLSEYLCSILSDCAQVQFFCDEYDKLVLLFATNDGKLIINILGKVRDELVKEFHLCLGVYLDDAYTTIRELKIRYARLCQLSAYRFFVEEDTIITHALVSDYKDFFDYTVAYADIQSKFQQHNFIAVNDVLNEIEKIKPSLESAENLRFFYRSIFLLISNHLENLGIETEEKIHHKEILEYYNYRKAIVYIKDALNCINEHVFYPDKDFIRRVDEYVRKNYEKELSLEMVAKHFRYEYGYFSKMFKKHIGVTFKKYLNKIRLENALKLMSNSNLKYTEISVAVGYKSYEHFCRLFREQYGCSPKEMQGNDIDD